MPIVFHDLKIHVAVHVVVIHFAVHLAIDAAVHAAVPVPCSPSEGAPSSSVHVHVFLKGAPSSSVHVCPRATGYHKGS